LGREIWRQPATSQALINSMPNARHGDPLPPVEWPGADFVDIPKKTPNEYWAFREHSSLFSIRLGRFFG